MVYKKFQNLNLSALGMGAMRLPLTSSNNADIDENATREMIAYAMEHGINYYDTAFGYHGGQSEIVIGKILNEYPRDSYYLATKFPGYDLDNMSKVEEIFEKQLEKTGMEYFDFYLFHNVCETNIDAYLDPKYGIFDYLVEQKRNGRIRHLGFSAHGSYDVIKRFLEAYGSELEFCQLQINYIDWTYQKAKENVELLNEYHIPVWVMEPLRGGKLADISDKYVDKLKNLRPEETVPAWAFRFLQSIKEVTVTLSGMSNFEQVKQNIATFETEQPLNEEEMNVLTEIASDMIKKFLPCTACRYCIEKCPKELDIPKLLAVYNRYAFTGIANWPKSVLDGVEEEKQPTACIGCKSCESVCPQQIKISEVMADFVRKVK